jgi:hypothetical protein
VLPERYPARIRVRLHPSNYALLLLLIGVATAWSQTESGQQPVDTVQNSPPASRTNADVASNSDEGPTWPSDDSQAVPPEAPSSFFMADLFGSQAVESDTGQTNSSVWSNYSRALGGLHFLKVKHRFETAVDYRAGEYFQDTTNLSPHRQIQELNATQLVRWRTGELSLADSMSNYAGGSFGSPWFGGAGLYSLTAGGTGAGIPSAPGTSDLFGVTSFGGIGQGEHFTNISVAEVSQFVSQRSILSAAAGYGITNFFDNKQNLINSSQISGLMDYSYELSRKSEMGLAYSYRNFIFPNDDGGVVTNLVELTYLRQVSRRLSLQAGVGPELERIKHLVPVDLPIITATKGPPPVLMTYTHATNVAAFGSLSYRLREANLGLSYSRGVTSGSGFYAGAQSDVGLLSVSWRLFRAWNATATAGYAHLSQVEESPATIPGQSYQFWFAGLAVGRELSRHWSIYASYQYNNESFASTICAASGVCDHVARNAALIGFRWRTRAYRLDHGDGQDKKIRSISDRQGRSIDSLLPKTGDALSRSMTKTSEEY